MINENTVKFYISYVDIEERWSLLTARYMVQPVKRGKELFWEMMDELHQEDDFGSREDHFIYKFKRWIKAWK